MTSNVSLSDSNVTIPHTPQRPNIPVPIDTPCPPPQTGTTRLVPQFTRLPRLGPSRSHNVTVSQPSSSSSILQSQPLAPPPLALPDRVNTTRVLLYETQVCVQKFSGRMDELAKGVDQHLREAQLCKEAIEMSGEKAVAEMADVVHRSQTSLEKRLDAQETILTETKNDLALYGERLSHIQSSICSLESLFKTLKPTLDSLVSFAHERSTATQAAQDQLFKVFDVVTQNQMSLEEMKKQAHSIIVSDTVRSGLRVTNTSRTHNEHLISDAERADQVGHSRNTSRDVSLSSAMESRSDGAFVGKRTRTTSDPVYDPLRNEDQSLHRAGTCKRQCISTTNHIDTETVLPVQSARMRPPEQTPSNADKRKKRSTTIPRGPLSAAQGPRRDHEQEDAHRSITRDESSADRSADTTFPSETPRPEILPIELSSDQTVTTFASTRYPKRGKQAQDRIGSDNRLRVQCIGGAGSSTNNSTTKRDKRLRPIKSAKFTTTAGSIIEAPVAIEENALDTRATILQTRDTSVFEGIGPIAKTRLLIPRSSVEIFIPSLMNEENVGLESETQTKSRTNVKDTSKSANKETKNLDNVGLVRNKRTLCIDGDSGIDLFDSIGWKYTLADF